MALERGTTSFPIVFGGVRLCAFLVPLTACAPIALVWFYPLEAVFIYSPNNLLTKNLGLPAGLVQPLC